jgi:hypothetical protein
MNAYTTRSRFRIQPRDLDAIVRDHGFSAAPHLVALERQRGRRVEAEAARQLTDHGLTRKVPGSAVTLFRRRIGVALLRAGERFTGIPLIGRSLANASAAGRLKTSG